MNKCAPAILTAAAILGACAPSSQMLHSQNDRAQRVSERSGLGMTTLLFESRDDRIASLLGSLAEPEGWIGTASLDSWKNAGWRLLRIDGAELSGLASAAPRRAPIATSRVEPVAAWARLLTHRADRDDPTTLMARTWISPGGNGSGGLRVQIREGRPRDGAIASFDPVAGGLTDDWWLPSGSGIAMVRARADEILSVPSEDECLVVLLRARAPERFSLGVASGDARAR